MNEFQTEILDNFEAYSFDYERELSKECKDYFHLWTEAEYIIIFMLYKYGYLSNEDFDSGWEKLKKQVDFVLRDLFKYILSCKQEPNEEEKIKLNQRPINRGLSVWDLVKHEYKNHASHDSNRSKEDCTLCQRMNWKGKFLPNENFCVEEF